jgi:hypothetical protein
MADPFTQSDAGSWWSPTGIGAGDLPNYSALMQQTSNAGSQSSQGWGPLIAQLQQNTTANGQSEQQARAQYGQAAQAAAGQAAGQAHGGSSPAALRQAALQQGAIGQGMSNGMSQATSQAQLVGQQGLAQAIAGQDQGQQAYLGLQNSLSTSGGQQALTQEQINYQLGTGLLGGGSKALAALAA